MDDEEYNNIYSKRHHYDKDVNKILMKSSPDKLSFSGNFTKGLKLFDINSPERRASMKKDIMDTVLRRTESKIMSLNREEREKEDDLADDNPMYEDPRDVIGQKPAKPPRKRNLQGVAVTSPRLSKEGKSLLKEQKRKLTKKYESLIITLMDRCEENVIMISEKDASIVKLKEKLKTVLEYNKLFAEENDQLKTQYTTLVKYVEECKQVIREERDRIKELEGTCKELGDKVKQYEVPDRDHSAPATAIPLVEVCMSCSSRQIILNQAREQNQRLQKDMQALKDVLYRLNVQLSRYQEKLRSGAQNIADKGDFVHKPTDKYDALDSLLTTSFGYKGTDAGNNDETYTKSHGDDHTQAARLVDLSGLLSAQALAPLFDAYQENLQEKDSLIADYEKQFENMNKKSKQIVEDNKTLTDKVNILEEELLHVRQSQKKLFVEKETTDIEKATLVERAQKAETKLKEVYEMYEDKMAAMMRDYETVHREYFATRSALEATEGKLAQLDVFRSRTVPADLHERRLDHCKRSSQEAAEGKFAHLEVFWSRAVPADLQERRLDHCKRLLEELKHQYSMENERKSEQVAKLQERLKVIEEKYGKMCQEHETVKEELSAALKNVRLYRKAAVIFRQRVKAATARVTRARRSVRRAKSNTEPLKQALDAVDRIKKEIKVVKARAYTSLEELERRIVEQERRAAMAQTEYRRELERASLALEHKEGIIRSLIDKVADVEEVRLSQINTQRLQGIVTDSDPPSPQERREKPVKLVPGPGGYFQEKEGKKKTK